MDKYLYFLVVSLLTDASKANQLILQLLRMDEMNFTTLNEFEISRSTSLIRDISKLKLEKTKMAEVWQFLLRGKDPGNMSKKDWMFYEPIITTLPESVISEINATDSTILEYFGRIHGLTTRQLTTFGDMIRKDPEECVFADREKTMLLKNLICGFGERQMRCMTPATFRELMERGFFKMIDGCTREQLRSLLDIGMNYVIAGPPSTWTATTVSDLGYLVASLEENEICQIRISSVAGISVTVIAATPKNVLQALRPEQVRTLGSDALLAWRRKTGNTRSLLSKSNDLRDFMTLSTLWLVHWIP